MNFGAVDVVVDVVVAVVVDVAADDVVVVGGRGETLVGAEWKRTMRLLVCEAAQVKADTLAAQSLGPGPDQSPLRRRRHRHRHRRHFHVALVYSRGCSPT